MTRACCPVLLLCAGTACTSDFDVRSSTIDSEHVIAVTAEPAEARPGERVVYHPTAVGPGGRIAAPLIAYSYCTEAKPLGENDSVADACATLAGIELTATPDGGASGPVPSDACRVHGPDTPPGNSRARDADVTGGYYQPVRLTAFGEVAFHLQRIVCNPDDVAADVAREFAESYSANQNPGTPSLRVFDAGFEVGAAPEPLQVAPHRELELMLGFGSDDREEYAYIDRANQVVIRRTEALAIDWFTTGGDLEHDRNALNESDTGTHAVTNRFTTPDASGPVTLWAVVHDARGGSSLTELELDIR